MRHQSTFNTLISGAAVAFALTALAASPSRAGGGFWDPRTGTFTEQPGDAGPLTGSADNVTNYAVKKIDGTLFGDADLYEINIGDPGDFSATIANAQTTVPGPQLFLFNSKGQGVAMDVASLNGSDSLSGLNLTSGVYYLGIAAYNFQPTDANGNYLFPQGGSAGSTELADSTATLSGWGSGTPAGGDKGGTYAIQLTGVTATPEPGMIVTGLAMLGTTGLGLVQGRRRAK